MTVSFLGVAIRALVLSLVLTPITRRLGVWAGAVRQKANGSTLDKLFPRLGGVAVFISLAVSVLMSRSVTMELRGIVLASGVVLVFGIFEDLRIPSIALRWFITAVATAILVHQGVSIYWIPTKGWDWLLTWAVSFVWVLGLSEAFRFLNGLDGLAAGSAAINSFFIGLYALATDQPSLLIGSFALAGAALGLLPYNYKPFRRQTEASILLGGGGAGFFGFTLGSLILLGNWIDVSPRDGLVPALIVAVPLFAMAVATTKGIRDIGASSPRGKARPHFQWPNLGIRKKETVAIIYLVNLCFGISAFLLRGTSTMDALLVLGQVVVIFGIIAYGVMVMRKRRA